MKDHLINQMTTPHERLFRDSVIEETLLTTLQNENPKWQEVDQLAVYKHSRRKEFDSIYRETTPASRQIRT